MGTQAGKEMERVPQPAWLLGKEASSWVAAGRLKN
jgi:hypothetical protein